MERGVVILPWVVCYIFSVDSEFSTVVYETFGYGYGLVITRLQLSKERTETDANIMELALHF